MIRTGAASAVGYDQAPRLTAISLPSARASLLGLALRLVARLYRDIENRQAGYADALAPSGVPALLELAIPNSPRRQTADPEGGSKSDPAHLSGESPLGRASRAWGTADAGDPGLRGHGVQVHDPPARTTVAELADVSPQSGSRTRNYGRAISFFVHLYRATREQKFLTNAERLAAEVMEKLYVETEVPDAKGKPKRFGIFRGHPAKPYYESNAFVGLLLWSLIELSDPVRPIRGAF